MTHFVEEIIKGRKTFFIAPDKTLLPEFYLEEYLTAGYECYFVNTDIFLPISLKSDVILNVFKDSILYFNVDAPIQNENWPTIISKLKQKYPEAKLGICFAKKQTAAERDKIINFYITKLGLNAGVIQLEYQKKNNFGIVEKALMDNQAMGMRKSVRAVCSSGCTIQFRNKKNQTIRSNIVDISLSHVSVILDSTENPIADYEKISDAQFFIKGQHITTDIVLFLQRPVTNGTLYVFAFCTKSGQPGLDQFNRQTLTTKIYTILEENCQGLLDQLFRTAQKATLNSANNNNTSATEPTDQK